MTIRNDLREIELHVWEGRLKTEIARDDADGWALWRRAPEQYAFPGGGGGGGRAPLLDLWARAEGNWAALRKDAAPGSTTFVLSHGALGRTLLGPAPTPPRRGRPRTSRPPPQEPRQERRPHRAMLGPLRPCTAKQCPALNL